MDPAWEQRQRTTQPALILVAGLAVTVLLVLFTISLLQRTDRVEREVTVRTAQLRDSEARLQSILDHSPACIFVKDLAGGYVLFNQQFEKLCPRPNTAIKGCTDRDFFPSAQAEAYLANDRQVLAAGRPMVFEETGVMDGRPFTCLVHKFPLRNAEGELYALCGIATDITERKQAELELQEKRRQLGNLISQLPGASFRCLFDENLTMLFASEGMLQLTGYPAEDFISGRIHLASLTVPADRPAVRTTVATALNERRSFEIEYRIIHREHREKWVLVRGQPFYDEAGALRFIEGLAIDVTALKKAEAEKIAFERNILETQKLESLGVLAGGIAHDFNNLLTAILGNASLMRYALPQTDSSSHTHLEQIENAARRAADLCSQMLAYAGKGRLSSGRIDLSRLVTDTTSLLGVSIGKNCELALQLADSLPPVLGDATQLRQIVMNLVINGSDAIGERTGGKITLTTFTRHADSALFRSALHQPKLEPGLYVGLEVTDNGCGMMPETIARIFEPFYTTKFSGRGLGLSAVLGIIQSHHGALFLESQPNHGSTFRLLLPAAVGVALENAKPNGVSLPQALQGTILVADDEEAVRSMVGKVLCKHGASVLLAADGRQALEVYRQQQDQIDLILLDLTMPGLSGEEILLQLQQLKARQKIIIMSGYGEEETMQRCAELGVVGFISKPFELQAVVAKLQSHLS
jgi:PAS domain S-box-containing protein